MTLYFQTHVGWGRMETDCIVVDWLCCTRRKWRNTTVCVWKHYSSVAAGISCKTHVYHARVRLMHLLMLFIAPTHRHWMTCEGGKIMKKGGCVGGKWRPDPERRFIINRDGVFWNEGGGGWGGKSRKVEMKRGGVGGRKEWVKALLLLEKEKGRERVAQCESGGRVSECLPTWCYLHCRAPAVNPTHLVVCKWKAQRTFCDLTQKVWKKVRGK